MRISFIVKYNLQCIALSKLGTIKNKNPLIRSPKRIFYLSCFNPQKTRVKVGVVQAKFTEIKAKIAVKKFYFPCINSPNVPVITHYRITCLTF